MFQSRKIATTLSISLLLCNPTLVFSQTSTSSGAFSILNKNDRAPFDGLLLDKLSVGILLTERELLEKEHELMLELELGKERSRHKLELDNLKISLEVEKELSRVIIEAKDKELEKLRKIAINSNDYTWLYIGGGFVAGVLFSGLAIWGVGQLSK